MSQKTINELLSTIDSSINTFVEGLSPIQERAYAKVLELVKGLNIRNGKILNDLHNIRLIGTIKVELKKIIISKPYLNSVATFAETFDSVTTLQNKYFSEIVKEYKPKKILEELKKINIDYTIEALTDADIAVGFTAEVADLLKTNITAGGSYAELAETLREKLIGTDAATGGLSKYAKQIATDSINQYNRSYNQIVASDLGLQWYQYVGSNIKTTRPFCLAMTDKRYFHESEIPTIIRGGIDGKKVSTAGMIENTNKDNFVIYAGGYNCGHGIYPVSAATVPDAIRAKFEKVRL